MALKVIGAGYPRTGTLSLKLALEMLGLGPCHHMTEVFAHPDQWPHWDAAGDGLPVDWDAVFDGYNACTDAPGCYFYRELADHYPDAKVILSLRAGETWFESMAATIFGEGHRQSMAASPVGPIIGKMAMKSFGGAGPQGAPAGPPPREAMIANFDAHNAAVIRDIAPERLLIFRASDGWGPLCDFLGVAVPNGPYPRVNSSQEFHDIAIPA